MVRQVTASCSSNVCSIATATCEVTVETATGINDISVDRQEMPQRFNVLGQPVNENYKGIVIEGGVKKIVR